MGFWKDFWGLVQNSIVVAIYKDSPSDCANYRPICFLSIVHKVYSSILDRKLIIEHQPDFSPVGRPRTISLSSELYQRDFWDFGQGQKHISRLPRSVSCIRSSSAPRYKIWNALAAMNVLGDSLVATQSPYCEAKGVSSINWKESRTFLIDRGR